MISSALAYLLTLFMAFTIIPLLAFLFRMVLIMILSKFYWSISRDKSPVKVLKFSIKLAQPVGFFTAIFHGYAALWMGTVFLRGMQNGRHKRWIRLDRSIGLDKLDCFSFYFN